MSAGCEFSGNMPIVPTPQSRCVFLKRGEKSRFQPKESLLQDHGKLITGYEVDPSPGVEYRISAPPEPTGFSDIVRPDQDGNPVCYRIKGNRVYSLSDKYIGKMDEVFPPGPSMEEMKETHKQVATELMEQFSSQLKESETDDG
jgi:hypothetical protein